MMLKTGFFNFLNPILILIFVFKTSICMSEVESKKNFVFNHSFKEVWAAAQIVLGSYPLETNDQEAGLIVTSKLVPGQFWQAPFEDPIEDNYSQVLRFQFFKPNPKKTQLQIVKKAAYTTDFFGSKQDVLVPAWEELRLVYLIKREIEVKQILTQVRSSIN